MLEKPVMSIFIIILTIFFLIGGLLVVTAGVKQYQFMTQAHILANTMARSGHWDITCEDSFKEFCKRTKINASEIELTTIPTTPYELKTYGEIVKVNMKYNYKPKLAFGSLTAPFDFPIEAPASAVSTCVPGLYVVP